MESNTQEAKQNTSNMDKEWEGVYLTKWRSSTQANHNKKTARIGQLQVMVQFSRYVEYKAEKLGQNWRETDKGVLCYRKPQQKMCTWRHTDLT